MKSLWAWLLAPNQLSRTEEQPTTDSRRPFPTPSSYHLLSHHHSRILSFCFLLFSGHPGTCRMRGDGKASWKELCLP